MEKVEVTARFGLDGQVVPLNFVFGGRTLRVESIGRRWEAGGSLHFLVMTPGNDVYELIYPPLSRVWRLKPVESSRKMA